jgi:hypothetical protein
MDGNCSLIRFKTISQSNYGGRKGVDLLGAAAHNLRDSPLGKGVPEHIDPSRICLNVVLEGASKAIGVEQAAEVLWEGIKRPSRKDRVQAIEVIFSVRSGVKPKGHDDLQHYFESCLSWLKRQGMPMPVVSAVIHFDEGHPHMHVLMLPIQGGGYVGGKPIARERLKALNDTFFNDVAGPAGFARAQAKFVGHLKRRGIDAVMTRFEDMGVPDRCGAGWAPIKAGIERDPTPFVIAFDIDLSPAPTPMPKPIGFSMHGEMTELSPIGFEDPSEKEKPTLCRFLPSPPPSHQRPDSSEQLSRPKQIPVDADQPQTISRCSPDDASGAVTRVRDEFADDCSVWRFD